MKNTLKLVELDLVDLPHSESSQINGGWLIPIVVGVLAKVLADEWDTTKKAAVDAWNGTYNPPN